jgi:cytochrome c-type biogenesis protein CcmF
MKPGILIIYLALAATFFSLWHYFRLSRVEENKKIKNTIINNHLRLGRAGFYIMTAFVSLASVYLWYLIFSHQFQVSYIYRYTSRDLGLGYLFSAFWAGQEGSFLFWALMMALMGVLYVRTAGRLESWSMLILNIIQAAFLILLIIASPFVLQGSTPADGAGLNPLLQNPWMVIHPPVLFLGYAAIAIPFVIALAALIKKDYEHWVKQALPWSLFSSITIGAGIILGAYWAYKVLGWGGYWGWDPVENSSLIAWMVVLAFFHGLLITRFRGSFQKTNFSMAIFSFVLVLYATFLTRSGVLADFSVHSFQDLGITAYLTLYIFAALLAGILILINRRKEIPKKPISFDIITKEQILVFTVWAILFSAFLILIGTSFPLITQLIGNPSQVGISFYNQVNLPIAVIICLLLGVAPFLIWNEENFREVVLRLIPSVAVGIIAAVAALFVGMERIIYIIFVGAIGFGLTSNLLVTIKKFKSGWQNAVAPFSHVGVALLFIGIIISGVFSKSQTATITKNETAHIMGHDIIYKSDFSSPDGKDGLNIEYTENGKTYNADPRLYMNNYSRSMMSEPYVNEGLFNDFYLSLIQRTGSNTTSDVNVFSIIKGEQKTYHGYDIIFKAFEMGSHENTDQFEILAVLQVSKDGHSHEVRPGMLVEGGHQHPIIAEMPGTGYQNQKVTVSIASLNAESKQVDLSFSGLTAPQAQSSTPNEQVAVEISHKPFMGVLWIGTILLTLGTILAMKKRTEELKLIPKEAEKQSSGGVCKKCKSENEPEAKFCSNCGSKLTAVK